MLCCVTCVVLDFVVCAEALGESSGLVENVSDGHLFPERRRAPI